jgi:hypothetical protein
MHHNVVAADGRLVGPGIMTRRGTCAAYLAVGVFLGLVLQQLQRLLALVHEVGDAQDRSRRQHALGFVELTRSAHLQI